MKKFLAVLSLCFCVADPANGLTISDDFTGGFNQPWVFFGDNGSIPPDFTALDTSGDNLLLFANQADFAGGMVDEFASGQVGLGDENFAFVGDAIVSADITRGPTTFALDGLEDPPNNDAFVALRATGGVGYILAIDFNSSDVDVVRADPDGVVVLGDAADSRDNIFDNTGSFDPAATYRLELQVVGFDFVGRVYDSSGTQLAEVTATDSTYPNGFAGVGAAINDDGDLAEFRTIISTTFDNFLAQDIGDIGFEADFDGDGDVDGDDFLSWQAGFPTASGISKMDGDFDNDGDVDGDDFLGWQQEFPSPGSGSGNAIPEPAAALLMLATAIAAFASRRSN